MDLFKRRTENDPSEQRDLTDRRDGVVEMVAEAERLRAEAVPVEGGVRVRLRKRIVTQTQQITVDVSHEELVVEHLDEQGRVLTHRPAGPTGNVAVRRGSTPAADVVLHREVVEVVKRVVPVERARVFVDTITHEESVTDDVRREVIEAVQDHDPGAPGIRL